MVASVQSSPDALVQTQRMRDVLALQKQAFIAEGSPGVERRREWIDRAIGLLVDHQRDIADALAADFGHRSAVQSRMVDVMSPLGYLKDARRKVASWMRPERRRANFPFNLLGGRAYLVFQPLGVVGVAVPWNAPFALGFSPLAYVFAAGNRVMIKAPEQAPRASALLRRMIERAYSPSEAAVFEGGPEIGREFSRLPFDHLLFTGSAATARHVMAAAAEHLVPVTLELGGKAPAILGRSADFAAAVPKIVNGRIVNCGQVCMAPDYVLAPEEKAEHVASLAQVALRAMYPTVRDNADYTAMISERSFRRLRTLVEEAQRRGARVIQLEPELMDTKAPPYRFPPTLVMDAPGDSALMHEEIFGPVLPIQKYRTIDDAIRFVNERERPLALYYFGRDSAEKRRILAETWAGGVSVNDVMMHPSMTDLPFGGVGASGMGRYVGREGFLTFSNVKSVYEEGWLDVSRMSRPPYGKAIDRMLAAAIRR